MQTTTSLVLLLLAAVHTVAGGVVPGKVSVVNGRIINGEPVAVGEYPAQISLFKNDRHHCGASILNEYWALTAAHCVYGVGPYVNMYLIAGTINLDEGGTVHRLDFYITHPEYNESNSYINDVAVIKVKRPFVLDGTTTAAIQLPVQGEETPEGSAVTVVGWGSTTVDGFSQPQLLKADNVVSNQELCASLYWDRWEYTVYPSMICAAGAEEQTGACSGDSGGPLFRDGVVVGLVSWSYNCGQPPYPNVFTRVSSYVDWINQQISA